MIVGVLATAALGGAAPALAGAPNYTCEFGPLSLAADVHRDTVLIQDAPTRPVRQLTFVGYGSGGSGFTASHRRERYAVRLVDAGGGKMLRAARSELVRTTRGGKQISRGVCTAVTGDHRLGWIKPSVRVRVVPRPDAPVVRTPRGLPFVWSRGAGQPPLGWLWVTLWAADGTNQLGSVRELDVRFA